MYIVTVPHNGSWKVMGTTNSLDEVADLMLLEVLMGNSPTWYWEEEFFDA
jgi:hypothetical protein